MEKSDIIVIREIKPALSAYIRKALVLLKKDHVPDDDSIHDIRVLMKKARATLKLTKTPLKSEWYEKDSGSLKQVGKTLSVWRDNAVNRKIMKELKKKYPEIFVRLNENEKIRSLLTKPDLSVIPEKDMQQNLQQLEELLRKTGFRIRFNQMKELDNEALKFQLMLSYQKVKGICLECRCNPKPEKIHLLRKRSKDLLYQLWFFRPRDDRKIKAAEKRLGRLTTNLGKHNDLTQLMNAMNYDFPGDGNSPEMDELIIKIKGIQDKLLLKIWDDAFKCFSPGIDIKKFTGLDLIDIKTVDIAAQANSTDSNLE